MFWITGILGLALVLAPFLMGFAEHGIALWTSLVLGVIALAASSIGLVSKALDKRREYWALGLAGLAAFIAPFVFGYARHVQALWAGLFMGAALVLASLWASQAPSEISSHH